MMPKESYAPKTRLPVNFIVLCVNFEVQSFCKLGQ